MNTDPITHLERVARMALLRDTARAQRQPRTALVCLLRDQPVPNDCGGLFSAGDLVIDHDIRKLLPTRG
jgi:hypothetical protein